MLFCLFWRRVHQNVHKASGLHLNNTNTQSGVLSFTFVSGIVAISPAFSDLEGKTETEEKLMLLLSAEPDNQHWCDAFWHPHGFKTLRQSNWKYKYVNIKDTDVLYHISSYNSLHFENISKGRKSQSAFWTRRQWRKIKFDNMNWCWFFQFWVLCAAWVYFIIHSVLRPSQWRLYRLSEFSEYWVI